MIEHEPITIEADVVTVSHDHGDHSYVNGLPGSPKVFREQGSWRLADIELRSISSFHDNAKGSMRGPNSIFVIKIDGLRICHLGDLGHVLNEDKINAVGSVEVLLLPVGGTFTVGPKEALTVAEKIGAPIWIPMHYKTEKVGFPLAPLKDFLDLIGNIKVERRRELFFEDINSVPTGRHVYVLDSIL
jgi:L-ascorbate metabolism protein UlaG (beta-lactamase superfamily)